MRTDRLYFGAAYYDEYMPESRVDADMQLMKQAGMNVIRIAESTWSTWEPREGEFDFTSLHRMLRGAQEYGIQVIVGTPTYAIPPWLARKYPDILADTHSGPGRYGHRQLMDITHPGYLNHCEKIIRSLLEQVQPYDCVIGFQLDNETKPYDTCGPRVQRRFRDWLQKKFGTVEAMNKAYGLAFWSNAPGSWEDLPDVRGTINGSLAAAFEAFQRELVTEFMAWQRGLVDQYRKPHQFVTHNFDFAWEPFHCKGLQPDADQFAMAEHMTVAGCDIYHPSASRLTGMEISFGGDVARALKSGANYLVLETQAQGPFVNFPYPGQLRLQAFSHLAGGANMIEYWHWHSIHNALECHWKGVLSHDLLPGKAYEEIASVGADLQRIGSHLVNLQRHSRVGILLSNKSLTAVRQDASFTDIDYNRELLLLYRSLYRMNISCDMLPDTTRGFSGYDLVIAPCLYSADDALIGALKAYVQAGGHLLATYRSFFTDEHGTIRHDPQPHGLTEVFGMTYDQFCGGETVPEVEGFMELLRPYPGTEVLKRYDHAAFREYAAATCHSFGSGSAAYIGARLDAASLETLLTSLLPRLGVAVPENRWPLILREGINDHGRCVRYLLNYSPEPVRYSLKEAATELLSQTACLPDQCLTLEGWGVAVLEL